MKFKDRLEALKWMCENVGRAVLFDETERKSTLTVYCDKDGRFRDWPDHFFSQIAHNFRTEDDKSEMDWRTIESASTSHYDGFTLSCLKEYHNQLMTILEARFGK